MGKSQRGGGGSMKNTFNLNNFSNVAFCTQNRKTTLKPKHENTKKAPAVRSRRGVSDNVVIAIISLIALLVAIYTTYRYTLWHEHEHEQMTGKCNSKLRVLLIAPENSTAINHVFERMHYEVVHDARDRWDVLWSTAADDAFDRLTKLQPQQLVIRFPHAIVNMSSPRHLRAFALPEMKRQLRESAGRRFIIKDCPANDTSVDNDAPLVVQELMKEPLTVAGALVELSAVVVVTSIDPLRIYREHFHATFTPDYESLPKHFCLKSIRNVKLASSLAAYRSAFDDGIDDAIVAALESFITGDQSKQLANVQMMQFRFLVDLDLAVHITDVKPFVAANEEDHERIIYGVLKLTGAANPYEFSCRRSLECPMLSTLKDIVSASINYPCDDSSCSKLAECELSLPCLNQTPDALLLHLHRSFREHMQRGSMRRIFPARKHGDDALNTVNQLSPANRLSIKWFRAKCDADGREWC